VPDTELVERRSYCRICPAQCGIVVSLDGDRVVRVRGDVDHPLSGGYTCPKGRALPAFHHDPRRLDHPMVRPRDAGGGARVVTWDELLDDLGARLAHVVAETGPAGVATYFGTWSWLDALGRRAGERFMRALRSPSTYSALTVDAVARSYVTELVAGTSALLPNLDPEGTGLTILVGTNPVVSHGHASGMPDPVARLRVVARRAGLWVLDPLRTETAHLATRHLALRPGSDHLVLGHVVRELLGPGGGADHDYLDRHGTQVDELVAAVKPFDRATVAASAGVPPDGLDDLVAAVRASGHVTVLTGTGTTMARTGNLTEWMAWALQIVTGSIDQPGGAWCNPGWLTQLDQRRLGSGTGAAAPGPSSRPDLPGRFGERPCAGLVDEIESGAVRALLVLGGNPVTALPDTARMRAALSRLDVLAVADVVDTATVGLATHVIPVAGQLERADITTYVELFLSQVAVQHTLAVVPVGGDRRPLWQVLGQVGRRLGLEVLDGGLDPDTCTERELMAALVARSGADTAGLGEATEVRVADPPRPRGWVTDHALPDGRWRLAPEPLVRQLAEERARRPTDPLSLVVTPRRVVRRMNSALAPAADAATTDAALVHPADAAAAGLADGQAVCVSSASGTLRTVVRLRDDLARGTVSVPHGLPDRNVSGLTSGAAGRVDPLTGMVVQSGIPVTLTAAD
jgi:anaerobic selenocysteine-containing dehydrogenase